LDEAGGADQTGNQGIDRTLSLLRAVAAGERGGARLHEIATRTGLSRSTTHRLLAALVQAGLLEQDADSPHYHLGFQVYALGRMAAHRHGLLAIAQASLVRLEEWSEDTVYLQIRSGDDALCIARQEGRFPIKTLTLSVGDRRPLGVGAGSLALLSALPDAAVQQAVAANAARLSAYPAFTPALLHSLVARTRADGFATNPGMIVQGMGAVGVPILRAGGRVAGALSIAAVESRMGGDRQREIAARLGREAALIGERLDAAACSAEPARS
jgi:DNA-binding IclR family transcriptional regulator